jgi:dethiobiotin synthetase
MYSTSKPRRPGPRNGARVERRLPGLFVTGTGTGVGKSVVAASIVAALRARGNAVRALKPVITGLDDAPDPDWPPDHELLARAAGCSAAEVALVRYGPAVSPHFAAELSGFPIDPGELVSSLRAAVAGGETMIVEGVGGLLVPISGDYDVRRLAHDLGLPLVIAARPWLGTINHTLLTLEAARRASLEIAGVVLTPWAAEPTAIEHSNRETIERLGEISVSTLGAIARSDVELLASAGQQLPLDRWLSRS